MNNLQNTLNQRKMELLENRIKSPPFGQPYSVNLNVTTSHFDGNINEANLSNSVSTTTSRTVIIDNDDQNRQFEEKPVDVVEVLTIPNSNYPDGITAINKNDQDIECKQDLNTPRVTLENASSVIPNIFVSSGVTKSLTALSAEKSKSKLDDNKRKRTADVIILDDCSNQSTSLSGENGRHGKSSRNSDDVSNSENIANNHDNNSRGAVGVPISGPKQPTLLAYFNAQSSTISSALSTAAMANAVSFNQHSHSDSDSSMNITSGNSIQQIVSPVLSPNNNLSIGNTPIVALNSGIINISNDSSPFPSTVVVKDVLTTKKNSSSNAANRLSASSSNATNNSTSVNNNIIMLQNQIQDLRRQLDQIKVTKEQSENKTIRLESEVKSSQETIKVLEERNMKLCKFVEQAYRDMAFQETRRKRDKLALDCVRLGKVSTVRGSGTSFNTVNESWEEGYAIKDLNKRFAEHLERKEELERRKKKLAQMKRQAKKTSVNNSNNNVSSSTSSSALGTGGGSAAWNEDDDGEFDLDLLAEADAIRSHLEQLKKDDQALSEEKKLLDTEKAVHQKELRRCQYEERSRFYRDLPCLNSRYLLVSMLGRGGFSEVWKALDLLELKEVAVKVHQLNPVWTEEKKQSYIKHVTREYTIHREMKHPRVVQLFDVFEIDANSFATVLEYCKGIDLDEKLKRHRTIQEKEARTIVLQILSGLKYLNTPSSSHQHEDFNISEGQQQSVGSERKRKAIIHFDLKPANILFDEMDDAKITDFGLSKIIDDADESTSMELTSQGAGTYWYLPPECFARGDEPARISSKVDVWSLGVIFYQMLYGKRPFGEGKSQEKVLSEGIILNASRVDFPPDHPTRGLKVSEEAKDLIRACLTADQRYRPDVFTLAQHPFLRNSK